MRSILPTLILVLALSGAAAAAGAPTDLTRALSAAFQEALAEGVYSQVYTRYVGLTPRYPPPASTPDWPKRVEGSALDAVLDRGVLRLGFCENTPYHFQALDGQHQGIDADLGAALAERIGAHYGVPLRLEWVLTEWPAAGGDEQREMYDALIAGLQQGTFDAAMSGLLVIPDEPVVSSTPTSVLYTGIFYTGRDGLDLSGVSDREALAQRLAGLGQEFTFLSTSNGGPSERTCEALAEAVVQAGGRATASHVPITRLVEALYDGSVHFVVGDSISLGYFANQPGFRGVNLDMPASDDRLDVAPFTLPAAEN